jgi:methoxymalonate biosynthesis acyl carrier protein
MTYDPRSDLRAFLGTRFPDIQLGDEDDIFELGFVNSLFAMELVLFIERTFAFELPNEDLTLDNFRTVRAMAELVGRRTIDAARTATPR